MKMSLPLSSLLTTTALTVLAVLPAGVVQANPLDGVVVGGSATIVTGDKTVDVTQTSNRAVIDWRSFNIGIDEKTQFYQPDANAIVVNRVNDTNPSKILGTLKANGNVVLINPNGVFYGAGSVVDVNGMLATTADIDNSKFMAGSNSFDKASSNTAATIQNDGHITAKDAGLIGLVAPNVINNGVINAKLGRVEMASGDTVTVDFKGNGLTEIAVSDNVKQQLVQNTGAINAHGGTIAMTAAAGKNIVNSLIDIKGELKAPSIGSQNGKISIFDNNANTGSIAISGHIDASGYNKNENGGSIAITGKDVVVKSGSVIDASGDAGGGTVLVGGNAHGAKTTLANAKTTMLESGAFIKNNAVTSGNGGVTVLWSDDTTNFAGSIEGKGGSQSGKGGFIETSGKKSLIASGNVDLRASDGSAGDWLLDPSDITIYDRGHGGTDNSSTFTTAYLEAQSISANINLMADNTITLNLNNDTLTLANNRNITLTTTNSYIATDSNGSIVTSGTGGITLLAGGSIGNDQTLNLVANGNGDIIMHAGENIAFNAGGNITTHGGSIVIASNYTGANIGGIYLTGNVISSGGGNITLGGTSTPSTGYAYNTGITSGQSLFNTTIDARGSSGGGNIIINGRSGAGDSSIGVLMGGTTVETNHNGNISITGISGGTGSNLQGIGVTISAGTTISAENGTTTLTGTGGSGSGGSNVGVGLSGTSGYTDVVRSTGGNITIIGTVNGTQDFGFGFGFPDSGTGIFSNTGNITITGINNSGYGIANLSSLVGGAINNGKIGDGSTSGTITYITNSWLNPIVTTTTGSVVIKPYTSSTDINVGDGSSGGLDITSAMLNYINAGNITIGSNTNNGIMRVNDATWLAPVTFLSNSGIIEFDGMQDLGANSLTATVAGSGNIILGNSIYSSNGNITLSANTGTISDVNSGTIETSGTGSIVFTANDIDLESNYFEIKVDGSGTAKLIANNDIAISHLYITTQGGDITLNSDRDANNAGGISFVLAGLYSNGGNITLGGGIDPTTGYAVGSASRGWEGIGGNYIDLVADGGNIVMNGRGGSSTNCSNDICSGISAANVYAHTTGNGSIKVHGISDGFIGDYSITGAEIGADFETENGDITIIGENYSAQGNPKAIALYGNVTTTGTGSIYLKTANTPVGNFGIYNNSTINSNNNVTVISNSFENGSGTINAVNNLIIRPETAGATIGMGYSAVGNLIINDPSLANLSAGTIWIGGYGNVGDIGYINNAGDMDIDTSGAMNSNIHFVSTGDITIHKMNNTVMNGDVYVRANHDVILDMNYATIDMNNNKNLNITAGNDILNTTSFGTIHTSGTGSIVFNAAQDINFSETLNLSSQTGGVSFIANKDIVFNGGGSVVSQGGSIVFNSDRDANHMGGIVLTNIDVESNGGNIIFGGGLDPSTGFAYGSDNTINNGVKIDGSDIIANGGNILMNGVGGASSGCDNVCNGIGIFDTTITTTGSGTITLFGDSGDNGSAYSVNGIESYSSTIQTENGNLTLKGTAESTRNNSHAVDLNNSNAITTGTGSITLQAVSTPSSNGGIGFGDGNTAGLYSNNSVTIIADRLDENGVIQATNDVTIRTATAVGTIGVGDSASGNLLINDYNLDKITAGNLWIGGYGNIGDAGYINNAGLVDINTTRTLANNTHFLSASGIHLDGGTLTVNKNLSFNGNVTLTANQTITGSGGTITFDGKVDGAHNLTVSDDAIIMNGSWGSLTALGATSLTSSNDIALSSIRASSLLVKATGSSANITVNGQLTTTATGNALVLAGKKFTNNAGASALNVTGGGHFLVWSSDPSADNRGDVAYNFKQYNAAYGVSTVLGTGNGFLYTIAPTVSVSLQNTANKTYDGTNTAALNSGNFNIGTGIDGDTVAVDTSAVTATYDNKNVGNNKTVTANGITLNSSTNGSATVYGYQVNSSASGNIGNISAASLTITANNATKTYGDTVNFSGTEFTHSALVSGDSITSIILNSSGAGAGATVAGGPYAIVGSSATGAGLSNYNITYVSGSLTVNKANLTVKAGDGSKTYGQNIIPVGDSSQVGVTGLLNGDTVTHTDLTSAGFAGTANASSSPYAVVASNSTGTGLDNYNITYVNGNITVDKANLTITANDGTKTYGDTKTFSGTEFTTIGLKNSDNVTNIILNSAGAASTANVAGGPYNIVGSSANGSGLSNYNITYTNGHLTVNKAALSITANNATKVYGTTLNFIGNEFISSGLVNGDTISNTSLVSSGSASSASAGTYGITASSATGTGLGNYNITYHAGSLTVTPSAVVTPPDSGSIPKTVEITSQQADLSAMASRYIQNNASIARKSNAIVEIDPELMKEIVYNPFVSANNNVADENGTF